MTASVSGTSPVCRTPMPTGANLIALDRDIRRALVALRWARVAAARARCPAAVLTEHDAEVRLNGLLERRRAEA